MRQVKDHDGGSRCDRSGFDRRLDRTVTTKRMVPRRDTAVGLGGERRRSASYAYQGVI